MGGIAIIGIPARNFRPTTTVAADLMVGVGYNTGNLAFAVAAHNHIDGDKAYYGWDFDPAVLNETHDRAVLVCANMVNPHIDLTPLADRIEQLRIPFCAFSMGVQAPLGEAVPELQSGTKRFLHIASEHAVSVGLRGEVTARILDSMGIHNWRIVGCPSNFLNTATTFKGFDWSAVIADERRKLGVHLEEVSPFAEYIAQCQRLSIGQSPLYFVQSSWPVSLIVDANAGLTYELHPDALSWFKWFGANDDVEAWQLVREKFRCFFGFADWIAEMDKLRFSFGARLHGNIVALQCGVPAFVVVHDERTRELSECLSIPHIPFDEFLTIPSFEHAVDVFYRGLEGYPERRCELAAEYITMFKENGIVPNSALLQIAASTDQNDPLTMGAQTPVGG